RIDDKFFIVKFDVKEILNINDIEIVELFLVVCLKLLEFADQNKIKIESYLEKEFKKLEGFFQKTLKIESQSTSLMQTGMGAEGKISARAGFPLVRLAAAFYAKMSGQYESRKIVRDTYRPRLSELFDLINALLININTADQQKNALVIIDGLDRVPFKQAKRLFVEDGQNLAMIREASILMTVPISIIHSPDSALLENIIGPIRTLKNIRLNAKNGGQDGTTKKNREIMKRVVCSRLEADNEGGRLITPEALELVVDYSGGVFRTIIDLVASAAINSKVLGGTKIAKKDMNDAVNDARIKKKRPLTHMHWDILMEIHENKEFLTEMNEERLELLHGLFALEYINGEEWYEVNPLLVKNVEEYRQKYKKPTEK
ncbi:MAG: hypothetical protein JJV92_09675, partial [Desulfosarcina sp.]|nr:hypothetical protein [Desulfobacterales bacterium]